MATSSTQSAWRSFGGDTTKTAYAGDMMMIAEFYIPSTQQTAGTAVVVGATNPRVVVLPAGAEVLIIDITPAITGGTTPTLNLGLRVNSTGVNTPTALINGIASVATKANLNLANAAAGANLGGSTLSNTSLMTLTAAITGAPTGGSLSGHIYYYVPNGGGATA